MSSYQTPNLPRYYATPSQTGGPPLSLAYPPSSTFQPGPPRARQPNYPAASYPTPTPLPQRWTPHTSKNMNMTTPGMGVGDLTPISSVSRTYHPPPNAYAYRQSGNGPIGYNQPKHHEYDPRLNDKFVTPLKNQHPQHASRQIQRYHSPSPTPDQTPMHMSISTSAQVETPTNTMTTSQTSTELPLTATPPGTPPTIDSSLSSSDLPNPFIDGVFQLSDLQIPAPFPGPYPLSYINQEPLQENDNPTPSSELRRSNRQGSASVNPWDYITMEYETREGEGSKSKVRRRFTKRELETLEVLWSTAKAPSKFQRQRLGAWLGVKSKHITVWFQNRRQEGKRHSREGPTDPQLSSRSNRGTYDPVTGKWRPVPLSCISSLQPPPPEKLAAVLAISLGEITREGWFEKNPSANEGIHGSAPSSSSPFSHSSLASRQPLTRTTSSSLDDVLKAREDGFGQSQRMTRILSGSEGQYRFKGEGEDRKKEMLALMPSDPPSSDLMELHGEEGDSERDINGDEEGESEISSSEEKDKRATSRSIGLGRPPVRPSQMSLGRATSMDIIASSSRAKQLSLPLPHSSSGPSVPSLHVSFGATKHTLPAVSTHESGESSSKRPRLASANVNVVKLPLPRPNPLFKPKDSFSRSQSDAVLRPLSTNNQNIMHKENLDPLKVFGGFGRTKSDVQLRGRGRFWQAKVGDKENQVAVKKGKDAEQDSDVLNAASSLLEMLSGNGR